MGEPRFGQKVPTLYCVWKLRPMFLNLFQLVIVVGHELEKGLSLLPLKVLKVGREICWQLHLAITAKGRVKTREDVV